MNAERLAERTTGIGGSDAAAALGLSSFKTPFQLWQEKLGLVDVDPATERMEFGSKLEDVIAEEYSRRTGRKVNRVNRLLRHPEHPFMLANLDRRIVGEQAGLECKNVNEFYARTDEFGDEGTDEVPTYMLLQCQHYMAVTGYERFDLAALVGGNALRVYVIRRDEELIAELISLEQAFWRHVEMKEPPAVSSTEEAKLRWPVSMAKPVEATLDIVTACTNLAALKEKAKEIEQGIEGYDTIIRGFMAESDTLTYQGNVIATWKTSKEVESFDKKALETDNPEIYRKYVRFVPGARRFLLKK